MLRTRSISRLTVLLFGITLIAIAGIDVFLLQRLAGMARYTASLLDDTVFASEFSVALYLLPALFAGIGVNLPSHVLVSHLIDAEREFDLEGRRATPLTGSLLERGWRVSLD